MTEEKHSSSKPPPSRAPSLPDWAADKAVEAKGVAKQALTIATEARDTGKRIEAMMGSSPNPVLGVPGSGLFGVVATIKADVHTLATKLDGLVDALTAQQTAAEKVAEVKRGRASRVAGWIAGPTIALAVGTIFAWLAGFHR